MNTPLAILNSPIITSDGIFYARTITLQEASRRVALEDVQSFIGRQSTVDILSTLLDTNKITLNRGQFTQEQGQHALVFKLKGRPEEGKVYSVAEIEAIGFEFKLITKVD